MTRNVHHVVNASQQPNVAVFVKLCAVASEVNTLELRPVGLFVAVWVAPNSSQHTWPWLVDNQQTGVVQAEFCAFIIKNLDAQSRQRALGRTWLQGGDARQR